MENWQHLGVGPTVLNPWHEESPMKHSSIAVWYNSAWPWGFLKREYQGYQRLRTIVTIQDEPRQSDKGLIVRAQPGLAALQEQGSQPGNTSNEWGSRVCSQLAAVVNQVSSSSNTSQAGPRSSWKNQFLVRDRIRMRIRMRSSGHNEGQRQSLMTGHVHSDKAGWRSSQEVILQLWVPASGIYGQGQAWPWLSWGPTWHVT